MALFIPLTFSPLWGWGSPATIVPLALTVVFLVAFVLVERRAKEPMLPLGLVTKNRAFAAGNSAALLNYMAVFGVTTLTSVYLRSSRACPRSGPGLLLLMQPVLMAVLSPFTGRLSDKVGSRALATGGMVLVAGGMAQLAFVSGSTGRVLIALGTIGVGMALFSAPEHLRGHGLCRPVPTQSRFRLPRHDEVLGAGDVHRGARGHRRLETGPRGARLIFLGESGSAAHASAFADGFQAAMLVGAALALAGAVLSWIARLERQPAGHARRPDAAPKAGC